MYTRMIDIDLYIMLGGMGGGDTNMNMFGPVFQQLMQQQMHQQMNHQPQQHTPTQPQQSRTPQPQPPPQPPQPPPHAQQGVPNMFATGSAPGMASAHQQAAAAAAAAAARATGGIGGMHMPAAMQDMIQNQIQQQMAANGMPSFGGMHVHMTVNGESVPMPPMPGTAPGGMPSMSGSGAPGGMPMPMPGMPGEVPGGDQNLLGAASVFQQLMQMQQQQQQRQQQGQPSPTPPSAPPPHAPAHPQQPPPNMHFGAANLPSGFEQIQQQIHQQATAAAAAAVAGAGLQMSPDMQEMIQSQIQQQLQGMGMQGMPMPPHGGPQQPPHHPRNAPVPAQEPQMATFVNAGGPGIQVSSVSLSLCLSVCQPIPCLNVCQPTPCLVVLATTQIAHLFPTFSLLPPLVTYASNPFLAACMRHFLSLLPGLRLVTCVCVRSRGWARRCGTCSWRWWNAGTYGRRWHAGTYAAAHGHGSWAYDDAEWGEGCKGRLCWRLLSARK